MEVNGTVVPQCGTECILSLLPVSSCLPTNQACLCADSSYANAVTSCIMGNCTVKEGLFMWNFTVSQCEHPEHTANSSISVALLVLFCLETIFFLLRLLSRALKLAAWGWDDLFITASFAGTVVLIAGVVLQGQQGMGRDLWTLTPDQITQFAKNFFVFGTVYALTLGLIRISICFFYLRLFPDEKVRGLVWATQIFNALCLVIFFIVYFLQCRPLSYHWTQWDGKHQGSCFNFSAMVYTHAAVNLLLDIWMLALPFSQIVHLTMSPGKKLQAFVMFGCGIFLTIASILRLQSLIRLTHNTNPTKDFAWPALWSSMEVNVGTVLACLPASRLVVLRYLPNKLFTYMSRFANRHRLATDPSCEGRSPGTWASEKRDVEFQPPARMSDPAYIDQERACSTEVSVSPPAAGLFASEHPEPSSGVTAEGDRRESELPLIAGVPETQSLTPTRWRSFVPGEQHNPVSISRPTGGRIWAEQHLDSNTEPVMDASIPRSQREEAGNPSGSESA